MYERLDYRQACGKHGTYSIGINRRIRPVRVVRSAHVRRNAQDVLEIAGQGGVPSHSVIARLEMLILSASEDFNLLSEDGTA